VSLGKDVSHNTSLKLERIIVDADLQHRTGLDHGHIEDLAAAYKAKAKVRRPRVFQIVDEDDKDNGKIYAIDQHRIMAATRAGMKVVPVILLQGTWADARDLATSSNTEHLALKRSIEDKRRAVMMTFDDHPDWTDNRVAKHTQVAGSWVAELRKQHEKAAKVAIKDRVAKDGTKGKAGKGRKKTEAKDVPNDAEPATPRPIRFEWAKAEECFGWMKRGTDALADLTGDKNGAKEAHEGLRVWYHFAGKARKTLEKKE
jgi:hypothetical protein